LPSNNIRSASLEDSPLYGGIASAIRLIGTMLAEQHETWSTGKKYFDMEEFVGSKKSQPQAAEAKCVASNNNARTNGK